MRRVLNILAEPFPYYLNNDRYNTWLGAGMAVFMVAFLALLLPMTWFWFQKWLLIGAVIFFVCYTHIVWFPKLFPNAFDPERWTVGKYILFTFWQLVIIGLLASVLIHIAGFHPQLSLWKNMYYYFIHQTTYGSISIVLLTFVIRDVMLKRSLRNALHANRELERIRNAYNIREVIHTEDWVTIQSDTSESVDLCPHDILYIEANDNYSTLYWKNGMMIEKRMLRINLKGIEGQINNSDLIRCHRSYLVNINAITRVSGNANGYKLSVRDTDFSVPVSRSKGKEVIERIERIRSIAEAYK